MGSLRVAASGSESAPRCRRRCPRMGRQRQRRRGTRRAETSALRSSRVRYDLHMLRKLIALCALVAAAAPAAAQVDARMFRQPAVSADKIAFVYAGDIWLVPKAG